MLLGAVTAMILLNGCASANVQGDSDPWKSKHQNRVPRHRGSFLAYSVIRSTDAEVSDFITSGVFPTRTDTD